MMILQTKISGTLPQFSFIYESDTMWLGLSCKRQDKRAIRATYLPCKHSASDSSRRNKRIMTKHRTIFFFIFALDMSWICRTSNGFWDEIQLMFVTIKFSRANVCDCGRAKIFNCRIVYSIALKLKKIEFQFKLSLETETI